MKKTSVTKKLLIVFVQVGILLTGITAYGQGVSNEAEWTGNGYALKKIVSNTLIQSGVNFSYTIMFSAPAGATSINIQDQIPPALEVVNVPPPAMVNTVTPTVSITGTPGVNEVVSYSLSGLPAGSASSGSFTIVVKFPEGTTCDGETARNRAGIRINDQWFYTPFVSTTATASDPWKISKSILSGAVVNPNGGNCGYMMLPDDTVKYRLYVMKNSPYWGNVTGQMNMTSAVVTDVLPAGAILVSSTCGATQSGNVITWTVNSPSQLLDAANPYAWYYCDIEVYYPAASFPAGSFIYNDASLDGIICNQQVTHTSNQTCIEVLNYTPNLSANFQKYISLTNRVPGCTGIYTIVFCNNGNVPLTAFNINDVVPSGVSVDEIKIYNATPTTTMNLNLNSSSFATGISSYYTTGALTSAVNNIQLQMTGTLPVGNCIYMYVYFTVNPNPTGTVVTNCASFDGLSNPLTLPDACVSFTVEEGTPKPCLIKDICSPQSSYDPGEIVRFRIRVQNIGSADISGATLQDILHSNFNYIGNETYYSINNYNPPCSSGGGIPSGATAWSGVNPVHSGNNLSWVLPDIPSDCQLFYSAYCGTYGTSALPYYFIEFDVEVDSFALPGVTPNEYEISGGNLPSTVTSNTVNVLVVASFGQQVEKQVSTNGGSTFASSGSVNPGGTARYRLNYKNTSNVPVSGINLVDLLPLNDSPNDWLILDRTTSRGSTFGVTYNANHTTALVPGGSGPAPSLGYSPGSNLCLPIFGYSPGGCTPPSWSASPDQNLKMDYMSFALGPNVILQEEFDVNIPGSALVQQTACNDFAAIATAGFLLNGTPQSVALTPIAAPPVCISVDTTSSSCCDSILIEQVSDPTGALDCCVRISTECEVKAITVQVTNGTLSSASWNCGNIPAGYSGQSSFTFPGNGCAVDMINCIEPTQTGPVTVTFVINFQNGEECEKSIELDCGLQHENCCDSIQIRQVVDADGTVACCTQLITTCEVDSVLVTVNNGTFSSNAWNCVTPIPSAAIGQSSFMFDAAGCVLDMTNCYTPNQSGIVSVNYLVFFSNGEKCEKGLELDCVLQEKNCCDSIQVRQLLLADDTKVCCTELTTTCHVDSVLVTVNNGTFSSNAWNCSSPLPTAAIGQSSYMFIAGGCELVMENCIEPDQTGTVTVNYLVFFSNGEKCEKGIEMDCVAEEKNCCDSIRVNQVMNAAGALDCCTELITTCEVDSVLVTVNNGTLGSNTWNCSSPLPTAAIGQSSYMFDASGCVVNMTNCIEPDQTGVVSVNYLVYFSNGEKCEKGIEMDCVAEEKNCCDSIRVNQVMNAAGALDCCAELITTCEVDSVLVTVNNGTFGSNTWNCSSPIPTAALGQSSYMFDAAGCVLNITNCIEPDQTGVVSVNYLVYFSNGEKCEKGIEMDCVAEENCCDSIRVERVQVDGECCARLVTTCEVESVEVTVGNGVIGSVSWNCGPIAGGYVGQTNYTFGANACAVDMTTCVSPSQSGIITLTYTVTFLNGEKCEKTIELDCPLENDPCCAEVELKLKPKWPWWNTLNGLFMITNLDPSVPICYVELAYAPAATMSTGNLWVDGVLSGQAWNPTRIPATGNLVPAAINDIKFNLVASGYKGVVTVCVVKCDGTRCCFEFKWNKSPWGHTDIPIEEYNPVGKLVGISISPKLDIPDNVDIKYVSFGMADEGEITDSDPQFFAISAAPEVDDEVLTGLASATSSYMGKHSAFFELEPPVSAKNELGIFNMVFANGLPKLGCTLFDTDGNIVAAGEIEVTDVDSVATAVINTGGIQAGLFDFVNLYPNPNNGDFKITFVTGELMNVEIQLVNAAGQVLQSIREDNLPPGVHNKDIDVFGLPAGLYKTVLRSENKVRSKSAVIK